MKILINEAVRRYLLAASDDERRKLRKSFEYLECGLWDGGLRIKRLQGVSRTVLEARANRGDRILFTLGRAEESGGLAYVWSVVPHDDVERAARAVQNAPFLAFSPLETIDTNDADLESMEDSLYTQERPEQRAASDSGPQRWFLLGDAEWERLLQSSQDELEIFLFLTPEQRTLLEMDPPLLVSGTAGSGKTTLSVYYLLRPGITERPSLFLTYNQRLRNFCERLYSGLLKNRADRDRIHEAHFRTFKEFCLSILPGGARSHFLPDREVNPFVFRRLFAKHKLFDKYDSALVWEEIRSIIKGAKPQINSRILRSLLGNWNRMTTEPDLRRDLREEILGVCRLSVRDKAESAMLKLVGCSLGECARSLDRLIAEQNSGLMRALESIASHMEKHEADYSSPLMTFTEYELLGRKRAPSFVHNREDIYAVAQWYQSRLDGEGLWDEIDLTRAVIRAIDNQKSTLPQYDFVCCDEVQDFTDIQLSLLVRLPRRPEMLMLCGDPKQIINPSGFRWEEARALFYDRGLPVPSVHSLTLNFRCVGGIVLLSNALLKIKQELTGVRSDEKLDDWKFQGSPPVLVHGVSPEQMLDPLRATGADRIILTREERDRDALRARLGTELVFTIEEAKGLEFRSVVLWKFCRDAATEDLWLRFLRSDTARIHDAVIRHEINMLYVGITRAQQNLLVYDGPVRSAIWSDERLEDLLFPTESVDHLQELWRAISTPEEWKKQGDYFLENEHYRAAAECYRNAGEPQRMLYATALGFERRGEFVSAGEKWEAAGENQRAAEAYEKGNAFSEALSVWELLENTERILLCRIHILEKEKHYVEAAQLWEDNGRFDRAREAWRLAKRFDRVGELCEREGEIAEAARNYATGHLWDRAARCYEAAGRSEDAAKCLESAGKYKDAAHLWRALKRDREELSCLEKAGDILELARYHEVRQDWKRALHLYRSLPQAVAVAAAQKENVAKQSPAERALHASISGNSSESAPLWEKARQFDLAGQEYRAAGSHFDSGRCFLRAGQSIEALLEFGRDPVKSPRSVSAMRRATQKCISDNAGTWRVALEQVGDRLRNEQHFAAAAGLYESAGRYLRAADCAATANLIPEAMEYLRQDPDTAAVARFLIKKRWFSFGASLLQAMIRRQSTVSAENELALLLEAWTESNPSEEEWNLIVQHSLDGSFYLPIPLLSVVLEKAGLYSELLQIMGARVPYSRKGLEEKIASWIGEARRKESAGEMAAAGVRYLIAGDKIAATRCWSYVDVTENNLDCMTAAGHRDRVIDYYDRTEQYSRAAIVLLASGNPERSAEFFRKAKMEFNGAALLEKNKYYPQAAEMYQSSGQHAKAAMVLEKKLKSYEEAAVQWEAAGNQARAEACRRRRH